MSFVLIFYEIRELEQLEIAENERDVERYRQNQRDQRERIAVLEKFAEKERVVREKP